MKHGHAMSPENIPWTGGEYQLAQQRAAKEMREAFDWFVGLAAKRRKRTKHK